MIKAKRTGTKVVTGKVRLSYANIFQPRGMDGQEPKYSVCLLIPKSDKETIKAINEAMEQAKKDGASKWNGKIPTKVKTTFYDGDVEKPEDEAYAGCYYLNASNKRKPGVVDANVQPILDATEVYSGCYGRAVVNFYAYNAQGSKGITASLQHIQKVSDGEPLGGAFTRAEDEFDDIESSDEEDFLS